MQIPIQLMVHALYVLTTHCRELGLPLYWLYLAVCVMPASRDRRGAMCFVHPGHIFYEDPIRVQHVWDDALPAIRKFNGAQH